MNAMAHTTAQKPVAWLLGQCLSRDGMVLLCSLIVAIAPCVALANGLPESDMPHTQEHAVASTAPPLPATVTEIATGQSGIVVNGIVALPGHGFALLSVNGKPQDMFRIGSEVMPGTRLVVVFPDRVVLDRGGRHESYRLQGAGRYDHAPSTAIPTTALRHTNTERETQISPSHRVNRFTLSRTAIGRELNTPQELLSQAVLVPTPKGMLLSDIEPNSLIHDWGLKTGDLLLSVNGQTLRGPDDLRHSYEQIRRASLVRLEIERSGKHESLVYELQ